jgi:hypothetical protein
MTEREERDLAWRVAEGSEVFDFDTALELVQRRPAEAEKILRMREENKRTEEEFARLREQRRLALREDFG